MRSRTCATTAVVVTGALVLLAAAPPARADAPPPPRAGIVPLELGQVARASGPELRIDDPDISLANKRVRFLAEVAEIGRTAAGEDFIVLTGDGSRLVFRLPGPLDGGTQLVPGKEWEVIARLDRPVQLGDGRAAIAVMPDALVKTPGLPSEQKPTDVVVRVAGADFLRDPGLVPYESDEPLYRVTVLDPGKGVERDFLTPGRSALAEAKDSAGRTMYNAIRIDRADDGRERTTSCIFRNEAGRLRNVAYAEVEMDAAGNRVDETSIDLESDQFNDTWSARKRDFEPNTYAATCLGTAIAGFPIEDAVVRFYVYGGTGLPIPVYAYVDGEETVSVRGRPERAKRIRIGLDVRQAARNVDVPEVWRDRAEAAGEVWFAGETTYWIAAEPPHLMLRFEGPLGPPGSPEARIERIR